jgi:hypothetical protein
MTKMRMVDPKKVGIISKMRRIKYVVMGGYRFSGIEKAVFTFNF